MKKNFFNFNLVVLFLGLSLNSVNAMRGFGNGVLGKFQEEVYGWGLNRGLKCIHNYSPNALWLYITSSKNPELKTIKHLVEHGVKISSRDFRYYSTCLNKPETKIIKYLVKNGSNISSEELFSYIKNSNKPKLIIIKYLKLEPIKYLLEHGVKIKSKHLRLILFSKKPRLDVIGYLVKNGIKLDLRSCKYVFFPEDPKLEIIKCLIDTGSELFEKFVLSSLYRGKNTNYELIKLLMQFKVNINEFTNRMYINLNSKKQIISFLEKIGLPFDNKKYSFLKSKIKNKEEYQKDYYLFFQAEMLNLLYLTNYDSKFLSDTKLNDVKLHKKWVELRTGKTIDEIKDSLRGYYIECKVKNYLEKILPFTPKANLNYEESQLIDKYMKRRKEEEIKKLELYIFTEKENKELTQITEIFLKWVYSGISDQSNISISGKDYNSEEVVGDLCRLLNIEFAIKSKITTFMEDLVTLEKDEASKDFEIIVKNENNEDEKIKVHKFILMARSGLFREMFQIIKDEEETNSVHDYTGKSPEEIRLIIKFFYSSGFGLSETEENNILKFAESLNESVKYYLLDVNCYLAKLTDKLLSSNNYSSAVCYQGCFCK